MSSGSVSRSSSMRQTPVTSLPATPAANVRASISNNLNYHPRKSALAPPQQSALQRYSMYLKSAALAMSLMGGYYYLARKRPVRMTSTQAIHIDNVNQTD